MDYRPADVCGVGVCVQRVRPHFQQRGYGMDVYNPRPRFRADGGAASKGERRLKKEPDAAATNDNRGQPLMIMLNLVMDAVYCEGCL